MAARAGVCLGAMPMKPSAIALDLRGVKCPLNWAHAKVRLEQMERGQILEITLDDPRGARDIPRAAEAEGYVVLESRAEGRVFHLRIEK
jgi:tRNA 2-thiouridine synthesizing protein A